MDHNPYPEWVRLSNLFIPLHLRASHRLLSEYAPGYMSPSLLRMTDAIFLVLRANLILKGELPPNSVLSLILFFILFFFFNILRKANERRRRTDHPIEYYTQQYRNSK
jgi:hypothetical protein